ncbi:MAG: bifunctional UDP-N-acetylglucosamine diphosphorylase/glucosamine-1-phosphate N-acetyltransferase GlmU [Gaiellaceae bacterium]
MARKLAAIVMAGGLGTRMRSATPKHLHPILGRSLIDWVIDALAPLEPAATVLVSSPLTHERLLEGAADGVSVVVQPEPRGTGDAVAVARAHVPADCEDIVVIPGDTPLLTGATLTSLVATHDGDGASATVLSFNPPDAGAYGRIVRDDKGGLERIVEAADATPEQLALGEVNSSIYVFRAESLWETLASVVSDNAQGEQYLTDVMGLLVEGGHRVSVSRADDWFSLTGVNTRVELAEVTAGIRDRILETHMLAGVTLVDPASTWIDAGVSIESDVTLHPFTVLRGSCRIETGAEVGPHVVAIDARIGPRAVVGPFAYLRPDADLAEGAKAGTFVEIKNSQLHAGAKVPHLSYIGDADIGEGTNIGAGAITANYRAERYSSKQRTTIGRNVHTGSQNVFVPPISIGDDAWTAAGSAITEDVPSGALAIARARQVNKERYGEGRKRD